MKRLSPFRTIIVPFSKGREASKNNEKLNIDLRTMFKKKLQECFVPLKIKFEKIGISYRYKKS